MNYPGLFKQRYELKGRDWLRFVLPEDKQVFSSLGRSAADHGRAGGLALVEKRGREYMSTIGKRGALVTNLKRYFHVKALEEMGL